MSLTPSIAIPALAIWVAACGVAVAAPSGDDMQEPEPEAELAQAAPAPTLAALTRTRLSARFEPQDAEPGLALNEQGTPRLRLRLVLGERSNLVLDRSLTPTSNLAAGFPRDGFNPYDNQPERPYGIGLEFKATNAAQMAGLRQGTLFKMNMSSGSSLGLRARKGRLVVMWRAQW